MAVLKNSITKYDKSRSKLTYKRFEEKLVTASICSGGGASEESLRQLGFNDKNHRNLFMCEWDKNVAKVYKDNFESENYFEDFYEVDWSKVEKTHIHILFISTPCQEFSIASGKRKGLDSQKGQLYIDALIQARIFSPDRIINENVTGLLSSGRHYSVVEDENGERIELNYIPNEDQLSENNWILLEEEKDKYVYKSRINPRLKIGRTFKIIEDILFEEFSDYNFYVDILNTKDFNTPQNRSRCFLILIKKELDLGFKFPEKQELTTTVSDLLEKDYDKSLIVKNREIIVYPKQELKNNKQLSLYGEVKNKDGSIAKHRASKVIVNPIISPCQTTNGHLKVFDNGVIRKFSPTEQKRLHGFSEEYKLPVDDYYLCAHIMGNTLSPIVMKQLIVGVLFIDENSNCKLNRIIIHRKLTSKYAMNYLTLKEEIAEQYLEFLNNGGEIIIKIEKFKSVNNRKENINKDIYFITINNLEKLGIANKKYQTRRYKIIGKVLKDTFLSQGFISPFEVNTKNKKILNDYRTQLFNNTSTLGLKRNTVVSVINHKNKIVEKQISMMIVNNKPANNIQNKNQLKAA